MFASKSITFLLIAMGTVVGLAGTDLVLPAVPGLPDTLGGNAQLAQWVLAAFAAGTGFGLLAYGELGTRFGIGNLLVSSLLGYAVISWLAIYSTTLYELSVMRFFQGFVAAAPAVFAPVMIKAMYGEHAAVAMLGRIGSIESITPALAPILGAWLLQKFGWEASFQLTAFVALVLCLTWLIRSEARRSFGFAKRSPDGYGVLLRNWEFMRNAIGQAFTLGALLIIVFAAPSVITLSMGGQLRDFIIMQVLGISFFFVSVNTSHRFVQRFGAEQVILVGSVISAFGCVAIFALGLYSEPSIALLWFFFIFVNLGLGIRGPAGFYKALLAAGSNDSRGSALIVLLIMFTAALGTAAVAPFVEDGLAKVAALASLVSLIAVACSIGPTTRN